MFKRAIRHFNMKIMCLMCCCFNRSCCCCAKLNMLPILRVYDNNVFKMMTMTA